MVVSRVKQRKAKPSTYYLPERVPKRKFQVEVMVKSGLSAVVEDQHNRNGTSHCDAVLRNCEQCLLNAYKTVSQGWNRLLAPNSDIVGSGMNNEEVQ